MEVLVLIFNLISILFSIVSGLVYIPNQQMHKVFLFSISSLTPVTCCDFDKSLADRCVVISLCNIDLNFSDY